MSILCEDKRLENFIFALIVGTPTPRDLDNYDIWDYKKGVEFFVSVFIRNIPSYYIPGRDRAKFINGILCTYRS